MPTSFSICTSTPTVGRARLLDGSTPRGPSSWLRRVPRAPAYSAGRGVFEFQHPTDYPIALATDLQVGPSARV
jgi:hypothetical protein